MRHLTSKFTKHGNLTKRAKISDTNVLVPLITEPLPALCSTSSVRYSIKSLAFR